MKILVCSDSHGAVSALLQVINAEKPDYLIHLGDGLSDLNTARRAYPSLPALGVRGNNDGGSHDAPYERTEKICEKLFFMAHGHTYGVKMGLKKLLAAGKRHGADILLFGHTHLPRCFYEKGALVINPGSIFLGALLRRTYSVITIDQTSGKVCADIKAFRDR